MLDAEPVGSYRIGCVVGGDDRGEPCVGPLGDGGNIMWRVGLIVALASEVACFGERFVFGAARGGDTSPHPGDGTDTDFDDGRPFAVGASGHGSGSAFSSLHAHARILQGVGSVFSGGAVPPCFPLLRH